MKYIGTHVSFSRIRASKPIDETMALMPEATNRAMAFFMKPKLRYTASAYTEKIVNAFNTALVESNIDINFIIPHASYVINMASANEETRKKSVDGYKSELALARQLGIKMVNFHPGTNKDTEMGIGYVADCINKYGASDVITVLETMEGTDEKNASKIGKRFEELAAIIDLVDDKSTVGVCIDTAHICAAGYNVRTGIKEVMEEFDAVVGLKYLKAMHLNDSKFECDSGRDQHMPIGEGVIGLDAFKFIMNSPIFDNIPMITETHIKDIKENSAELQLLLEM